jgi:hypothetical protein
VEKIVCEGVEDLVVGVGGKTILKMVLEMI